MSQRNYDPDPAAVPSGSLATALLSQRDLSARIPINFVTLPSVTLTSACFSDRRYDDYTARRCLSNLLATGFRRIIIDVYWDALSSQWSLCPAAIPPALQNDLSSSAEQTRSAAETTGLSLSNLPTSGGVQRRATPTQAAADLGINLQQRQTSSDSSDASASTGTPLTSLSGSPLPTEVAGTPGLFQVGQYQCTSTANINLVRDVFEDHFVSTGNNLNATLKYMILNLRSAELVNQGLPDNSTNISPAGNPISRILNTTLSPFLYTPALLQEQRANLNASWFTAPLEQRPDSAYFRYTVNESNIAITTDGWPSEGYAELIQAKRILVGFGDILLPTTQYNASLDDLIIFPRSVLMTSRDVTISATNTITSGCLYTNDSFSPLYNNNASFVVPSSSSPFQNSSSLLPACGISPLLSDPSTISPLDPSLFTTFVLSSLWSWQPDQPRSSNSTITRCTVLNLLAPQARWEVAPCTTRLRGACRIANQPYEWTLSQQEGPYESIQRVCPPNSSFAAPRTALENRYLAEAAARIRAAESGAGLLDGDGDGDGDDGVSRHLRQRQDRTAHLWLNLNDLDLPGCFVQGVNATCPYSPRAGEAGRRVVVPIVAAVIVFVLAGLTLFVKCAANRAGVKRRRKRGGKFRDGLGEYEGVPS
ncbi:hypothetical protein CAC42_3391 [Sphaceloma murrayae]|uniref:Maintenance of telomere capping protein 6 n=1 Tax=Sphaceloma murrayae TaxID=2082308 RepID=A0A2K1R178_9PEZI|nr:hypothetical protein CAC42_3391 [Sphaceloma murrayae]